MVFFEMTNKSMENYTKIFLFVRNYNKIVANQLFSHVSRHYTLMLFLSFLFANLNEK